MMKQAKANIYVSEECDLERFGFILSSSATGRAFYRYEALRSWLYVDCVTRKLAWLSLSLTLVLKIIELAQLGFINVVRAEGEDARPIVARLTQDEWREIEEKRTKKATT